MKCIAVGAEHTARVHLVWTHHVRRLRAEVAPCSEECTGGDQGVRERVRGLWPVRRIAPDRAGAGDAQGVRRL